ncbi:hypothetical protein SCANM63S_10253 [Streptomyces canarius]
MLLIVIGAMLFCGLANLTSNTRQIFAFSRDGAMPGSRWWHSVSLRTRTPVKAVWLAVGCSLALVVPGWWSHTAFTAIVSVNVVGLFLAYAVPIFLRLRLGDAFQPGPWHLGRWGRPIGWLAVTWILLSGVLFMLPQASPITVDSFNYAPIALAVVCWWRRWWFATARRRFQGPVGSVAGRGRRDGSRLSLPGCVGAGRARAAEPRCATARAPAACPASGPDQYSYGGMRRSAGSEIGLLHSYRTGSSPSRTPWCYAYIFHL